MILAPFASPGAAADEESPAVDPGITRPAGPDGEEKSGDLRDLDAPGPYRTVRAGEGFRTRIFGRDVVVPPRDRRSVSAWSLGLSAGIPGITSSEVLPFGAIFLWRRPDEDTYLRAIPIGIYDEVLFAKSAPSIRPFEGVLLLNNYNAPVSQSEPIDGTDPEDEELLWGRVFLGFGPGFRRRLEGGAVDNMIALSLTFEPGYMYFDDDDDTAANFVVPQDTFEGRGRLRFRYDRFERNIHELAHSGYALGSDLIAGARANWEDWGFDGEERGSKGRESVAFSAYAVAGGGVPFVESERHRLIGRLHAGVAEGVDRFSGFQLGGGPSGDECEAVSRPLIPGAQIEEFVTRRYAIGIAEYRYEPLFFVFVGPRASVAWLERRRIMGGERTRSDDVLASIGMRLTTGFVFETQLQLDYDYNFGVIRGGDYGGHAITVSVSGQF